MRVVRPRLRSVCDDGCVSETEAVLAAAFAARCVARGLEVDNRLRLARAGDGRAASDPAPEWSLGELHEHLVVGEERTARGAWYTPAWLAAELVSRVIDGPVEVLDPTCGGGAFLLAAADRLRQLGAAPAQIVGELLLGVDIDPLAVAVTEAELWLWSAAAGEPTVAGDRLRVADALLTELPRCDAVVGNPPFLGQLKRTTAIDPGRRRALVARFGTAVRPYTDLATLFLLHAVGAVRPGGRVVLVQPQSVLAGRDAEAVRVAVDARARLADCWFGDEETFDAGVRVCAPVLDVGPTDGTPIHRNHWTATLLAAKGVPSTAATGTEVLAERAEVAAGFRDEYYGLVGHVAEGGDGPRLVTAGSIDPLRLLEQPVRFAKSRWQRPTVDVASVAGRAAAWVDAQHGPTLLVATQTRVLEAVADPDDRLVAGVPVIVVRPHDPAELWHLAAALHAPCVSAWMLHRTVGTGLSADTCRPTADLVGRIPLPDDADVWDRAARLARDLHDGAGTWARFGEAADAAYGIDDPALRSWWLDRLPVRCRT